jgi:hypothetical protein
MFAAARIVAAVERTKAGRGSGPVHSSLMRLSKRRPLDDLHGFERKQAVR